MKIKGLDEAAIRQCAERAGHFKLDNVRTIGNYTFFVLRMASSTPSQAERRWMDKSDTVILGGTESSKYRALAARMQYRKLGSDMKRWTGAVCFHGHKRFMDEIFKRNPDAVIVTMLARYAGRADFEAKWSGVGMGQHGPAYQGTQYREACNCYGG